MLPKGTLLSQTHTGPHSTHLYLHNHDTSSSPAPKIRQYLPTVAVEYDTIKYIRFRTKVTGAFWDEVTI